MERIRLIGPRRLASRVISALYRAEVLHIVQPTLDPLFPISNSTPLSLLEEEKTTLSAVNKLLGEIQLALSRLPEIVAPPPSLEGGAIEAEISEKGDEERLLEVSKGPLSEALTSILDAVREEDGLDGEIKEVSVYLRLFKEFQPLLARITTLSRMEIAGLVFSRDHARSCDDVEKRLEEVTQGACAFFRGKSLESGILAVALYPQSQGDEVRKRVFRDRVRPIHIPERFERDTYASTLRWLISQENELKEKRKEIEEILSDLSRRWRPALVSSEAALHRLALAIAAESFLAEKEAAFWISGWVPACERSSLGRLLELEFKGAVVLYSHSPEPDEYPEVPVQLKNPCWVAPYEHLIEWFSPPAYGTADPSPLLAVTIPLFFGLILGDVGYAAILAGMAWLLLRLAPRRPVALDAARIILFCAISSALLGVLYGEFFGGLWVSLGLGEPAFQRKEHPQLFLVGVVFLGAVHMVLGNLIGAWVEYKRRSLRGTLGKFCDTALVASAAWTGSMLLGGGNLSPALGSLGVAFVLKMATSGWMEVVLETPRTISSIFSYGRIMALGLASVILADLAQDARGMTGNVLAGLVLALCLHSLNVVLGLYSPIVQTLRLHFVEFFGRFYAFGGVPYSPLRNR
ncbi:MAG: hypothetical protein HYU64_21135 [Armatimonadetes bacterium]|nr:hypothetical protein [Armatimonadota bacterium]